MWGFLGLLQELYRGIYKPHVLYNLVLELAWLLLAVNNTGVLLDIPEMPYGLTLGSFSKSHLVVIFAFITYHQNRNLTL